MGQNHSSTVALSSSRASIMSDVSLNLCPTALTEATSSPYLTTSPLNVGPSFSGRMSQVSALAASIATPSSAMPMSTAPLRRQHAPGKVRQTNDTTPNTCDASLALSLAEQCFATQGCQSIFDQVWRCWQSWYPLDQPSQYQQPHFELTHCCLCGNYVYNIGNWWEQCRGCMAQNVTNGAGVPFNLTLSWASLSEADQVFCNRPTEQNLRNFIQQWSAVASIWAPLAFVDDYSFDTSTCQSFEQEYISYFDTLSNNIWSVTGSTSSTPATVVSVAAEPTAPGLAPAPTGYGKPTAPLTATSGSSHVAPNPTGSWLGKSAASSQKRGLPMWKTIFRLAVVIGAASIGMAMLGTEEGDEVVSDE